MRKQREQNTKRLFIAINLPEKIKEQIAGLLQNLAKNNNKKPIKWVRGDGLHITLHFLGYADGMLEEQVKLAMQSLSGKFGELKFILGKISAFPNLTSPPSSRKMQDYGEASPRVIFLECEQTNGKSVFKLQELLGKKLIQLGIAIDERLWKPHITLGRVKEMCDFKIGDCAVEPLNFSVSSFELMESRLTPQGAEYEKIVSYNL